MSGYRLLGRLGAGGMGQVYLGVSPGGRKVAVKLPSGKQIAFLYSPGNNPGNNQGQEIDVINADGTGRRTVVRSNEISVQYPAGGLAWSPDGTQLAFATTPTGKGVTSGTIAVVKVSGGPAHPLVTGIPGGVTGLSWAPGPHPLFTTGHKGGIWEADGHGSAKVVLQCGACQLSYPSWASDGVHFAAVRNGKGVVVATVAEGIQATIGPTDVTYVQWGGPAGGTSAPTTASAGSSGASSSLSQATLLAQVQVCTSRRPRSTPVAVLLHRLPARGLLGR